MAQPITWQNVGIASAYGATELMGMAQEQYSNAFKGLGDIAQGFRKDNLAKDAANSEAQLNWFTEQTRNLKPEQFTPETMNALLATITDPAARQAAVENFGKLGDEAFTRDKAKFDFSEAQKTADYNAALRPHELDKAALGDDLIKAQMAAEAAQRTSALASAGASNEQTALARLQREAAQSDLTEAKSNKAALKEGESIGTAALSSLNSDQLQDPVIVSKARQNLLDTLANNPIKQTAALKSFDSQYGTRTSLSKPAQDLLDQETKVITNKYSAQAASDAAIAQKIIDTSPISKQFDPISGQETLTSILNETSKVVADSEYWEPGDTDAEDVMPRLQKGADALGKDFKGMLRTQLDSYPGLAEEEKTKIINEAVRSNYPLLLQKLAVQNTNAENVDGGKRYYLSGDGREVKLQGIRIMPSMAQDLVNRYLQGEAKSLLGRQNLTRTSDMSAEVKALNKRIKNLGK